MLDDLKELIAIESTEAEAKPNAPFGEGCRRALDWFLAKAAGYGLNTGELDGYAGWAEYGEGKTCIGILCHIDVVPANAADWTNAPYAMTVLGGKVYGRGVADDKGPLVACLHVLKSLAEDKIRLGHRVRLIVGCNEESGSACLKHYVKHAEIPVVSIVPDADFPVINSEKGILHITANVPTDAALRESLHEFGGGTRPNVVPDRGRARVKKSGALYAALTAAGGGRAANATVSPAVAAYLAPAGIAATDFSFIDEDDALLIETRGIAGHAMAPDNADNALYKLFALFAGLSDGVLQKLSVLFSQKPLDAALGLSFSDPETGALTVNLGIAELTADALTLTLDFRLPMSVKKETVLHALAAVLPENTALSVRHHAPNLYVAEDSTLCRTLTAVYRDITGDTTTRPVQTGGGTYAREMPNAVAFGPTFPGAVTNIHNADECMDIAQLDKLPELYRAAILALDKAY